MTTPRRVVLACAAIATVALTAAPAHAQQDILQKIEVHGYGGWSFGRTTDNLNTNFFLFAHARGDYFHNEFALNVTAPLSDRLTIVAQPFWHSGHHANQTASGMDYVFGEWKFNDAARFRVGNVKQPFGLYTEIFDVGTLRPFAALSQSIYGSGGMIGKSYSGIGFTGVLLPERSLSVEYDVYGGGLETLEEDTPIQVLQQGVDTVGRALNVATTRTWRDVVGGRLVVRTPIDGFSLGASAYSGTRPLVRTGTNKDWRRSVVGAHAEMVNDAWWLRGEVASQQDEGAYRAEGAYGELAYRLTEHVQLAGTYGVNNTTVVKTFISEANVNRAPSLLEHREAGVGLNYWFTPNMVVKTSYHQVTGNRFSHPDPTTRLRAISQGGKLMNETSAVLVSGHLSF